MKQPENIILTTDFSAGARKAYPTAASFARKFKATIHLVHFASDQADQFSGQTDKEHVASILQALAHEAGRDEFSELKVTKRRLDPRVALSLPAFEHQINADLIITAARRETAFERFFLTHTAEELLANAAVPVLIHGVVGEPLTVDRIQNVLVPFANATGMNDVLPAIQFLSAEFKCGFRFLHLQPRNEANYLWFDRWLGFRKKEPSTARQLFEQLRQSELRHVEVEFATKHGVPSEIVVQEGTQHQVDLVIVGQRGFREGVTKRIVYRSGFSTLKVPGSFVDSDRDPS